MSAPIATETLPRGDGAESREVLVGEIAGVTTTFHRLPDGGGLFLPALRRQARALLFVAGEGSVACGGEEFPIRGAALCASAPGAVMEVRARRLSFVELRMDLTAEEVEAAGRAACRPYFAAYADCPRYVEAIKSPKTVSRTLMPEGVVPRLCIGSVETEGPDSVGAHAHPMLEQLFLGLPGNDCVVRADGAECRFSGDMLLHIPLGSTHDVRVEPGRRLHYVWVDAFRSAADMSYISEHHRPAG